MLISNNVFGKRIQNLFQRIWNPDFQNFLYENPFKCCSKPWTGFRLHFFLGFNSHAIIKILDSKKNWKMQKILINHTFSIAYIKHFGKIFKFIPTYLESWLSNMFLWKPFQILFKTLKPSFHRVPFRLFLCVFCFLGSIDVVWFPKVYKNQS